MGPILLGRMQLVIESHDDFLSATASGLVSTAEVLRVFKTVIDTATEQGFEKILIDFSTLTGELTVLDVYEIGKTTAEYCARGSLHPKVAVIGNPPTFTGFGAQVAWNRGLVSATFSEREPALNWLRAFGSKAHGV